MAYLLGNQACTESLQHDVQDIQWIINDILSRTGPVSYPSWKFPDKQACDVDIDDLLDLYDCSEDDEVEDRQVAHIALYELLIDRLIFLVRSMSAYVDNQLSSGHPQSKGSLPEVGSAGLIMKQFWTQMISLRTHFKQLQSENKSYSRKMNERDLHKGDNSLHNEERTENTSKNTKQVPGLETPGILGVIPPNTADMVLMGMTEREGDSTYSISRDTNNKSCQTYETAFVPCESCDIVQQKMKEAGEMVIKICSDQGLPCSLKKFKGQVMHVGLLTFNDVCRWMAEQNKDIARVGKQNELLQSTINPLKSEVKNCKRRTVEAEEKAKICVNSMKEEKETQTVLRKQMETKMKEQEKKHTEELSQEEIQREKLKKSKDKLESEMGDVKTQLEEQIQILKSLESDHRRLEQDLEIKKREAERSASLSTEVADLKVQLSEVTTKLEESSKLLTREQGKNRNASKHTESLQSKQDNLLGRMEVLGKENEDLGQQVASLEDEKCQMEDSIAELKVEAKELRQKARENEVVIKNLMNEKEELEREIEKTEMTIQELKKEVHDGKERERMIVEYPDLNGPVNPNLQGTGDIVYDMGNQVTANTVRIRLLEEQNDGLNESIVKIKQMHGTPARRTELPASHAPMAPQPLWQQHSSTLNNFHGGTENTRVTHEPVKEVTGRSSHVAVKQNNWVFGHTGREETTPTTANTSPPQHFVVGQTNTPKSHQTSRQGRPPSGKRLPAMAPVNTTSIGAYTQMKRSLGDLASKDKETYRKGKTSTNRPSSSERPTVNVPGNLDFMDQDVHNSPTSFSCPRCDKTYLKSRDLNIHMSYCTG